MKTKKTEEDYFLQSALREISLLRKHFNIKGQSENVEIVREITPKNVIDFFREYFAAVRPPNLGDAKILPPIDINKLRGWYLGQPDANVLLNLIVRHCLYVDQIVLTDPFIDLPHNQVLERPQAWIEVILNRALCLCALEEWIKRGIIMVTPSLLYYHPEIQQFILNNRFMFLSPHSKEFQQEAEEHIFIRLLVNEPVSTRNSIFDVFEKMGKGFSASGKNELLRKAQEYESKYPIRFRLPFEFYKKHFKDSERIGQIIDFSLGMPLAVAPFIANEIGAFLIFEQKYIYNELLRNKSTVSKRNDTLQQIAIAFQNLDFPFLHNVPLNQALALREKGYLSKFRVYLRDLWALTVERQDDDLLDNKIFDFLDRLKAEYTTLQDEWKSIQNELKAKAVTSGLVVGLSAGSALVFGNIDLPLSTISGLGAGLLKEHFLGGYSNTSEKIAKTKNQPLFVFLSLEKKL